MRIFFLYAFWTRKFPGSLINGVPALETKAKFFPLIKISRYSRVFFFHYEYLIITIWSLWNNVLTNIKYAEYFHKEYNEHSLIYLLLDK
ncbi:hypothetical protein [Buchnera aphidicola]|uniref:hypothetical protein n=1 Tax=Buchnera aphidicola TaxID=9 RepID=UPI00094D9D59|nr:hypothetical protein [Buchnera aphidicola]